VASFSVSAAPTAGQPVTFTDTSTDDGAIAARVWDTDNDGQFDDGTAASVQATYPASGSYTVRLQVTDDKGVSAIATQGVAVASAGGGAGGLPVPTGNLTLNPSFESGTAKWSCYHCTLVGVSPADAPSGTQAAQITMNAGFTSMALDDSPDTVGSTVAGVGYSATAYVKAASPSAVGRAVKLYLREKNAAGTVVKDTGGAAVSLGSAFVPIRVSAAALAGADKMDVRVSMSPGVPGDAIAIDLVSVVAG
jgi:PKD repeat protein